MLRYRNSHVDTHDREEIRRLKTENPNMAHKEAFSTAAKNVSAKTLHE